MENEEGYKLQLFDLFALQVKGGVCVCVYVCVCKLKEMASTTLWVQINYMPKYKYEQEMIGKRNRQEK